MNIININDVDYEIIEDVKEAIDKVTIENKLTNFFDDYDYIVGDWAYGKLRLKGFNDKDNVNFNEINNYENVSDYLKNNCAYGCRYFILKKRK